MRLSRKVVFAGVSAALLIGGSLTTETPIQAQPGSCVEPPREGFAGAIRDLNNASPAQAEEQEGDLVSRLRAQQPTYPDTITTGPDDEIHARFLRGSINVPVYIHDFYDPARPTTQLSRAQLDGQIAQLNRAFGGVPGVSAPTAFRFTLENVDYIANEEEFQAPIFSDEMNAIKQRQRVGGWGTLNLYYNEGRVANGEPLLGQATQPGFGGPLGLDGAIIAYDTLPGDRGGTMQGKTVVHEVGHWLNLYHTYDNGCEAPGDYVADTPPQAWATQGCAPERFNLHNYMDAMDDRCMYRFTTGQAQRMADSWAAYRLPTGSL